MVDSYSVPFHVKLDSINALGFITHIWFFVVKSSFRFVSAQFPKVSEAMLLGVLKKN